MKSQLPSFGLWAIAATLIALFLWSVAKSPKRDDPVENLRVIVAGKMHLQRETMHEYKLLERQLAPFFPADSVVLYRILLHIPDDVEFSRMYDVDSATYARFPRLGSNLVLYQGTGYAKGTYKLYRNNAPRDRQSWMIRDPQ